MFSSSSTIFYIFSLTCSIYFNLREKYLIYKLKLLLFLFFCQRLQILYFVLYYQIFIHCLVICIHLFMFYNTLLIFFYLARQFIVWWNRIVSIRDHLLFYSLCWNRRHIPISLMLFLYHDWYINILFARIVFHWLSEDDLVRKGHICLISHLWSFCIVLFINVDWT